MVVFHWSLCNSKYPQVTTTLLADLKNNVVWMVSIFPPISNCSNRLSNTFETFPSAPTRIGITITYIFHSFSLVWWSPNICLSFNFLLFSFCGPLNRQNSISQQILFLFILFLIIPTSGLLDGIRWSIFISISQRILCVSFSWTDFGLCIYHLILCSNFNLLHDSLWITFPTQSFIILYFFYSSLLYSITMFHFFLRITFTCVFRFSLWYNWSSWRFFFLCWYQKRFGFSLEVLFSLSSLFFNFRLLYFVLWLIMTLKNKQPSTLTWKKEAKVVFAQSIECQWKIE